MTGVEVAGAVLVGLVVVLAVAVAVVAAQRDRPKPGDSVWVTPNEWREAVGIPRLTDDQADRLLDVVHREEEHPAARARRALAAADPPRSERGGVVSVIFDHAASQWRRMRADYQDVLEAQYAAAEHVCDGYLVNARGRASGVTGMDVFTGPPNVVTAYGSDELVEHLREHPRLTLADFDRQWLDSESSWAEAVAS